MKIVGISACTAGIAHTYMAQEALEQECKKRGIDCKIETQGGMGIDNELSQEEIDAADVVILAVAVSVEMSERFDSKRAAGRVLDVTPGDAIKKTAELIDRAESIAASSAPEAVQTKSRAPVPRALPRRKRPASAQSSSATSTPVFHTSCRSSSREECSSPLRSLRVRSRTAASSRAASSGRTYTISAWPDSQ